MIGILLGITTFDRPKLLHRALLAIANLETPGELTVMIADNNPDEQQGIAIARLLEHNHYPWPIVTAVIQQRGFTYGRNAILDYGLAQSNFDYVVFMDDDQEPTTRWLCELVKKQQMTSADLVGSAVHPKFLSSPPHWAKTSATYHWDTTTDGIIPILAGDGGMLIARHAIELLPLPWYDHSYGLTGGADTELLNRLQKLGAKFAKSRDSKIYEVYADDRMSILWALRRAFRIGNTQIFVARKSTSWLNLFAIELFKISAIMLLVPVRLVLSIRNSGKQVDALCAGSRALGKLFGLLNFKFRAYLRIYGS